ncbi:unnamed protein product [Citrullus colocynthis]|uniref:Uncharacterized protein n=1 Tax=Citrullus colocynthis TaxID=252529 RepID=A0ABP0ZBE7_9ROSI
MKLSLHETNRGKAIRSNNHGSNMQIATALLEPRLIPAPNPLLIILNTLSLSLFKPSLHFIPSGADDFGE